VSCVTSYDRIAEIYDEDMGANNPGLDVAFYVGRAQAARGWVLELGCGTGRITLPLVEAGCRVAGLDLSLPMLQQLKRKAAWVACFCADMCAFALRARFSLIICPFSAFTYLAEDVDRSAMLAAVREHLEPQGIFIMDVFAPDAQIDELPDDHVFHDYQRARMDGTQLERTKTIEKLSGGRVSVIRRTYRFLSREGAELRSFTTEDRIRCYRQGELPALLRGHGFEILEQQAGFGGASSPMVFVCRKKAS
jgi:SAM-dependent methyltransferase